MGFSKLGDFFQGRQGFTSEMKELNSNSNPQFKINECEIHARSDLDTVTLATEPSRANCLKLLIDTGADISIAKDSSLKPVCYFRPDKAVEVKGTSNGTVKARDTVSLTLYSEYHETLHDFQVIGECF
jgi:hypothetical protein